MSPMTEAPRDHGETKSYRLCATPGGEVFHLVESRFLTDKGDPVSSGRFAPRSACSIRTAFDPVENENPTHHGKDDLCRACFRRAVAHDYLEHPAPFSRDDLRV